MAGRPGRGRGRRAAGPVRVGPEGRPGADELRARLARAEADRDVLALQPLTPDPEFTRRYQGVAQERTQVQQELGQAVAAAEAADRDLSSQLLAKKEALARLDSGRSTERKKDLDRATIRAAHAGDLLARYGELRGRGAVTEIEYQEQRKAARDAEVEVAALTQELKDGVAEKAVLRAHLDKVEAGRADPGAPLRAQVAALRAG